MKTLLFLCLFSVCVQLIFADDLPKEFKKCKKSDPELTKCLTESTNDALQKLKNGNEALGISKLEPFTIKLIQFNNSNTGSINLKQEFKNIELHNFITNTKILKFEFDFEKGEARGDSINSFLEMNGDYSISGKILLLPITGKGRFNVSYTDIHITQILKFEEIKKNDETYLHALSVETFLKPKKMYIYLENLFNGDKTLSDTMNTFLNENWEVIFQDAEPDYSRAFSGISLKIIREFFSKIPLNKLFD